MSSRIRISSTLRPCAAAAVAGDEPTSPIGMPPEAIALMTSRRRRTSSSRSVAGGLLDRSGRFGDAEGDDHVLVGERHFFGLRLRRLKPEPEQRPAAKTN